MMLSFHMNIKQPWDSWIHNTDLNMILIPHPSPTPPPSQCVYVNLMRWWWLTGQLSSSRQIRKWKGSKKLKRRLSLFWIKTKQLRCGSSMRSMSNSAIVVSDDGFYNSKFLSSWCLWYLHFLILLKPIKYNEFYETFYSSFRSKEYCLVLVFIKVKIGCH